MQHDVEPEEEPHSDWLNWFEMFDFYREQNISVLHNCDGQMFIGGTTRCFYHMSMKSESSLFTVLYDVGDVEPWH